MSGIWDRSFDEENDEENEEEEENREKEKGKVKEKHDSLLALLLFWSSAPSSRFFRV